jgi:hypothetical protein
MSDDDEEDEKEMETKPKKRSSSLEGAATVGDMFAMKDSKLNKQFN